MQIRYRKQPSPLDVDDYNYQLKQVDLAPRFYDAMNDGKTGSAKITNIIMKDVSKGTEEIFQKWSMERRIHATGSSSEMLNLWRSSLG